MAASASSASVGASWLKEKMEAAFPPGSGFSVEEITVAIFELLSSAKPDELLQNDMFELVGFERFELIGELLQHRVDIVVSTQSMLASSAPIATNQVSGKKKHKDGPSVASSVTIQTAEEKQLAKAMKRDKKRQAKMAHSSGNKADIKAALGFDVGQ